MSRSRLADAAVIQHRWELALLIWAGAASLQGILYLIQRRTRDATAVDAGWGFSLAAAAVFCAVVGPGASLAPHPDRRPRRRRERPRRARSSSGASARARTGATATCGSAGRPGAASSSPSRSSTRPRRRSPRSSRCRSCSPSSIAATASLPSNGPAPPSGWSRPSLEPVADRQLTRFLADPANRGTTLRAGLWRYSRHPNYFFQTLTWLAYGLIALAAPWGYLGLFAYALILYLVLFVTGIPPIEERALRSRGDDFRRYQQRDERVRPVVSDGRPRQ